MTLRARHLRRGVVAVAVALLLLTRPTLPLFAAAGDLDPTFGGSGKITTALPGNDNRAFALAIQGDGKILQAGKSGGAFGLVRFNSNGTLDNSFGSLGVGIVTTTFPEAAEAHGLALQSDGKIVAGGFTLSDMAVARYNADGTLDSSFGAGGLATIDFNHSIDRAYAVALQGDKILLAGTTFVGSNQEFALVRLNADGSLDTSFGSGGRVTTDFGGYDQANALAVQLGGMIVLAGQTIGADGNSAFALARYTPNGSLDPSFGSGGKVKTSFPGTSAAANALALQLGGKLVVAGSTTADIAVARYNADGSLDPSFGSGGLVTTDFTGTADVGQAVALQVDGKVIVGGATYSGNDQNFAVARFTAAGALDSSFGSGGRVTTDFGGGDLITALQLQPDGKIVASGYTVSGGATYYFAIARYLNDGQPPPPPLRTMLPIVRR